MLSGIDNQLLLDALIAGVVWFVCYLYIRRYLNPDNKGNVSKFVKDGVFGSLAAFVAVLLRKVIRTNLPF